jgi:hypothetical protein
VSGTIRISEDSLLPSNCKCGRRLYGPAQVYFHDNEEDELYEYMECSRCLTFYVKKVSDEGSVRSIPNTR